MSCLLTLRLAASVLAGSFISLSAMICMRRVHISVQTSATVYIYIVQYADLFRSCRVFRRKKDSGWNWVLSEISSIQLYFPSLFFQELISIFSFHIFGGFVVLLFIWSACKMLQVHSSTEPKIFSSTVHDDEATKQRTRSNWSAEFRIANKLLNIISIVTESVRLHNAHINQRW